MALRPLLRKIENIGLFSPVCSRDIFTTSCMCHPEEPLVLSKLKRGTGGRSSFNGMVATVFGATGRLGRNVITHLAKTGTQIIIPYRGDPYFVRDLKVLGDLGQILFLPFHLEDENTIRQSMRYSDVVINLIGKETHTRNFTLEQVHVDGAARIARISQEMEVDRLVHVSALCQNPDPPCYVRGPSRFMKSKAAGELEVLRERPDAIIFRPADMFGEQDRFLCYYAAKPRRVGMGRTTDVPLWALGQKTIKQPVYIGDVARGIVNSLTAPDSPGRIYEAVGPHRYRLDDLVKWIYFICRYFPNELNIVRISPIFLMRVLFNQYMARVTPFLSFERLEREFSTDTLSGAPTLADLNVKPTKLEDRIHHIVFLYRRLNYYWDAVGEIPEPPNPPIQLN
ncbi:39kDa subunit of ndufa9, NADH:ubiquinone oxidoreductase [Clonorchis sinensis]|uniref:NADH dehydrogenase [ubiquinone] 1 alpha subcomplex subunit 9, mitochondrial n=2 Tax=Clonorchis sinensis TaxID=79923 RepID=H2KRP2_CLOSI|nr:39kDa subunit of ndufa9, NADH:ubiquinone oxidoreductase [Clonorchis sinensis]GAA31353.2 NADH dehydrogenase (ubiquinone) 1 alpha subcomplex 9 [Clonorchis sinensis]